jgi:hypothetical protein
MSRLVRIVLAVVGLVAVIVGILYLAEPVGSLPTFFPGYVAHGTIHHHTRGYIAIAVGVILLIVAVVAGRFQRQADYYR